VEGLEDYPPIPPTTHSLDSEGKPFITTSAQYRNWITFKKEYLDWLRSDSVAMGLIRGAIKFDQREHIQDATTSKDIWDCLRTIHVTQRQEINVHYYYQELYTKKWNEHTTMSDHIGSFLQLRCRITESGQKLEDIHIVHAILLSHSRSGIWDVVKQNLLDKGSRLTLNAVIAELLSVSDCIKRECQLGESEKKQKTD